MTDTIYEGGCLCGAVRYRVAGPVLLVEYCHCHMCRRAAGAPVVCWVDFPFARFSLTKGSITRYRSSPGITRGFCAACGSSLSFQRGETPPKITLAVDSLDDPDALAPWQHIYVADAVSWLHIPDDLPRYAQGAPYDV